MYITKYTIGLQLVHAYFKTRRPVYRTLKQKTKGDGCKARERGHYIDGRLACKISDLNIECRSK